jgi:hypothetical protein
LLVQTGKRRKRKEETKGALREHVSKMNGHELFGCLTSRHPSTLWPPRGIHFSCLRRIRSCVFGEKLRTLTIHRELSAPIKTRLWYSVISPFTVSHFYFPVISYTFPRVLCTPLWRICTQIYCDMYTSRGRDGVVGRATCYGLDGIQFESR